VASRRLRALREAWQTDPRVQLIFAATLQGAKFRETFAWICDHPLEFKYDGGAVGKGGAATLFINNKKVGEGRIEKTILGRYSADETFDIGMDTGSPVSDDYTRPIPRRGRCEKCRSISRRRIAPKTTS
jgi:hypothetical protein